MFKLVAALVGILLVMSTSQAHAVALTWDNSSTDQLWSTGTNWNPDHPGAPTVADTVTFDNTGTAGAAGVVTNIVSNSVTVSALNYRSTSNFHTTQINSGQTLTVAGGEFYLNQDGVAGTSTVVNFRGSTPGTGTFTFNSPTQNFYIVRPGVGGTRTATLDASQLGNFNVNANILDVGVSNQSSGTGPGTLILGADNVLTANRLRVGGWGSVGTLRLGTDNIINANNIEIAWNHQNSGSGTILFNTGLTNPEVTIRNAAGTGRANLMIGWANNGTTTGHLDLTGGTVDALLGTVTLGGTRTVTDCCFGNGTGTITFNAGTIDATTIIVGRSINHPNALSTGTGTVHVNGGTLIADEIRLAEVQGPSAAVGTLNINGGAVRATAINSGVSTGAGTATRTLNFFSGTLSNKAGTDLTVSSAINFRLQGSANKTISADAGQTVAINANIVNFGAGPVGGITKIGDGTLLLNGANTYTGATQVNAGTVGGSGAASSDFVFASGSTLSPGNSAGTFLTDDVLLEAGSTFFVELGGLNPGSQYDQLVAAGNANLQGNLVISFIDGFIPSFNDTFVIIDADSVLGAFENVAVLNAPGYFNVIYTDTQVLLTNYSIPEPATLPMLGLAGLVWMAKRRRGRKA